MRRIFDNGATRARARAWGFWLLLNATGIGLAFASPAFSFWQWVGWLTLLGLGGLPVLVRMRPRKIPVLNYHSVSARPQWLRIGDQVSIAPDAFERQLAYLKRHGYRSLFISEAHRILAGKDRADPRGKHVALTFDDGYADNWIAALPLLKKYGVKATLFVSTGFIAEAEGCRETIEEKARADWNALDWSGYLKWPELKAMRDSGLVEIQSHGFAHTRVFTDAALRGFVGPGRPNLWALWNARPETCTTWWRELDDDRALWGHPVFSQGPALACRAYTPDPNAVAHLLSWARDGRRNIFAEPHWEERLREEWFRYTRAHGDRGTQEGQTEYERRVERDLREAKQALERGLHAKVEALCWPENAFSEAGERLARKAGYTVTVSNRHNSRNAIGETPERITRVFIGSHAAGFRVPQLDLARFVLELKVFEGWYALYPLLAAMHLAKKTVWAVKRRCLCRRDYLSIWD